MKKLKQGAIGILVVAIFSLSMLSMGSKDTEIQTSTNIQATNNQKIGWGIKRNDNHEQPDVGSNNKKVLEENKGICLGNKENKSIYLTFDEGYEAG